MKTINFIIFVVIFSFLCCKSKSDNVYNINENRCAVIIQPTQEKIDLMKSTFSNESDFYVVADDSRNYLLNAWSYLEEHNITVISIADTITMLNFGNKYSLRTKDIELWTIIFYKQGQKPKVIQPIDIETEASFFWGNLSE